jgi:hypothetical protein
MKDCRGQSLKYSSRIGNIAATPLLHTEILCTNWATVSALLTDSPSHRRAAGPKNKKVVYSMRIVSTLFRAAIAMAAMLSLAACDPVPKTLKVNFTVVGLTNDGLQITDTVGMVSLDIKANDTTATILVRDSDTSVSGGRYAWNVEISRQPQGQTCVPSGELSGDYEVSTERYATITCTTIVQAHAIGGTVSGLSSQGLVLAQGSDQLAIEFTDSPVLFTFPTPVEQGAAYSVGIAQQPQYQVCSVAAGSGTMETADIANVVVNCATESGSLSVDITGLGNNTGLALRSGATDYPVPAGTTLYTLPDPVPVGSQYNVTVGGMPQGLSCAFADATGVFPVSAANGVLNIGTVSCTPQPFQISGTITGLGNTTGLVLSNAGEQISVAANATTFAFTQGVTFGSSWTVTLATQPAGRTCAISNGSGNVPAHDITDVAVTCSVNTYTLGGSISGLSSASGLQIANNGAVLAVPAGATSFELADALPFGTSYALTVATHPAGLTCRFSGSASGTITSDVTSLQLACGPVSYTVGGSINGLTSGGLKLTEDISSQTVSPAANAAVFTFPDAINPGDAYDVYVTQQPSGQFCQASNTNGTATQDIASIVVDCQPGYTIGGTATGLPAMPQAGTAFLVLKVVTSGAFSDQYWVPVFAAGSFEIDVGNGPVPFPAGTQYTVSVDSTANGYSCAVDSGDSGTVGTANVTDVHVTCSL